MATFSFLRPSPFWAGEAFEPSEPSASAGRDGHPTSTESHVTHSAPDDAPRGRPSPGDQAEGSPSSDGSERLLFVPPWATRRGPGPALPPLVWSRPGPFVFALYEDGTRSVAEDVPSLLRAMGLVAGQDDDWARAERTGPSAPWMYRFRLPRERASWRIDVHETFVRVYRDRRLLSEQTIRRGAKPSELSPPPPDAVREHLERLQRGLLLVLRARSR